MDSQTASKNPENPVTAPTIKASFLATYYRQKSWLLPDTLIYYITKNPLSAKIYEKLIQSCKHFFIKNPILVASWLLSDSFIKECVIQQKNKKEFIIRNISTKIWITDKFMLSPSHPISEFIPKIYRCDARELDIWGQRLFFTDFIFLASKCERIFFHGDTIINKNGTAVTLENIFAVLENIINFNYCSDNNAIFITSKTVKELIQIPHFSNLYFFSWDCIPEIFDIECFYNYIKKNEKTRFNLNFRGTISEAYKNRLQEIIYEILADKNRKFRVPLIYFDGIDPTSISSLIYLQR